MKYKVNRFFTNIVLTVFAFLSLNIYFLLYLSGTSEALRNMKFESLTIPSFFLLLNLCIAFISLVGINFYRLNNYLAMKGMSAWIRSLTITLASVLTYILAVSFVFLAYFLFYYSREHAVEMIANFLGSKAFLFSTIFYGFISVLIMMTSNLQERFGSIFQLIYYLLGNTIKPHKADRGFLFIDLNHSTLLAEELGDQKYSALLRKCFRILEDVYEDSFFHLYQYVGDEAVISWKLERYDGEEKALQLFFDFKKKLETQEKYFLQLFGTQPTFKCAIHSGPVIEGEIGSEIKQLVYQGSVLNTASRMLGKCHFYETDCVISSLIFNNLRAENIQYQDLGWVQLKGKKEPIHMYSVQTLNHFF